MICIIAYSYSNIARIVFIMYMQVLKVRMRIEVTRFRNCAAQFQNWVAILKSKDKFETGTQF